MYTFEDEITREDYHVAGFFNGLVIVEDENGQLYVSKLDSEKFSIGEYIDDPELIPLDNLEDDFKKLVKFIFE